MSTAIDTISNYVYGAENAFSSVLVDRSLNFEREAGFAVQALTANDYAMSMAVKNKQSVINAVTNIAAIGISLNPAKRQAYLVPRDGKICLDISYMGLMDLAMSTGSILWAQAELVCEHDAFALNGFDKPPTHQYNPFSKDRGPVVGVYVVVKTPDGDYLTDCMSKDEIDAIMNRSQSVKSGKSSPWKSDYGEMAKKTVVKRAYKYWPKTDRLDKAIHHLNTDGGEGLVTQVAPRSDDYIDPTPIIDGLRATQTIEEMKAYWAEKNSILARQPSDHQALKDAYLTHLKRIKAGSESQPESTQEQT